MGYNPEYNVTAHLMNLLESIASLKTKIDNSSVSVAWISSLSKDSFARISHSSTAIEGNPLTLKEVKILADGGELLHAKPKQVKEVLNYFAALRYIVQKSNVKDITEEEVLKLHSIIGKDALDRGPIGSYRDYQVYVGNHIPPKAENVPVLMKKLLFWLNGDGQSLPAVISSAILHYRFEYIHPFGDGNGRAGRTLATWELFRRKFDTYHIFAVDEIFWENRPRYYYMLDDTRKKNEDLTGWLEFVAEAIELTLERVWQRIIAIGKSRSNKKPMFLTPKQEKLLAILQNSPMGIKEIQSELNVTKQGAHFIIKPLLNSKIIKRVGGHKTGKYIVS